MKTLIAAGLMLIAMTAQAQTESLPVVREIRFEGNETTQPKVMQRELVIREGEAADPAAIERSRQYIQDLGLFTAVTVRQEPIEGGVRLVYVVEEKYYLLAYPRLSANLDGQSSYGLEGRWSNVMGLNHNLRLRVSQSDLQKQGQGRRTGYLATYAAPFVWDSPYNISTSVSHTQVPTTDDQTNVEYVETLDNVEGLVTRTFADAGGAFSQGTTAGGGLRWQSQDRGGLNVPPPYGMATALVGVYAYQDVRFNVYSETGVSWNLRAEWAQDGVASDYGYQQLSGSYQRSLPVGDTAHQIAGYGFSAGVSLDGPAEIRSFGLGGSSQLRAYDSNQFDGDVYYLAQAEVFRPLHWPWLRVGTIAEIGQVFDRPSDVSLSRIQSSLGVALRLRFTFLVNFEVEAGYAIPLGERGGRFFGGRV